MSSHTEHSVAIAEQLLKLVKSVSKPDADPLIVWNTKIKIQNVCDSLLANVVGPLEHAIVMAESFHESTALYFVATLGIADMIGDDGATLAELSKKADVEPQFLSVVMSCVIGRGYFEEVGTFGSRVYKNSELSQVLCENHPSSLKSAIGFIGDEGMRASSCLLDAAKTTSPVDAGQKKRPALSIAYNFSGSIFEWFSSPEEAFRGQRMGESMLQLHRMANFHVSEDYPWKELASPIVDIGGGIGTLEMSILQNECNSHLDFVLFDLPKTIENARKVWISQPPAVSSHVFFASGNFMAPSLADTQIPRGNPTYIIRHVLHDWRDDEAVHILSNVRQAMQGQKTGRLLLVEMLLRPNSSRFVRLTSMQSLALNNGITRTQEEMEALLSRAGLKVARVTHMRAVDTVIEAVLE